MNKEETDLIIAEQNKSTEEILKAVAKVKADYHELCKLKDMRIAELEAEIEREKNLNQCLSDHNEQLRELIEKMKCCSNCDNWHWKHSKCEKKLKGDCFKQSKWQLRR